MIFIFHANGMLESRIRKDRLVPFQSSCRCPIYSHVLHDSINSFEHFEYGMIHALGFPQLHNVVIVIYYLISMFTGRKSPKLSMAIQEILIPLIGTCGVIGNLLSIFIFRMPGMKSTSNTILMSK